MIRLNHPFIDVFFPLTNQLLGITHLWKPPCVTMRFLSVYITTVNSACEDQADQIWMT